MSSVTESNLGLNYGWAYGESGWNTGMDDNLVKLGFTSRNRVKGILSAPPSTPSNGDAYIVGTSPTGLFSGNFGKVAIWDRTVWLFLTPKNHEVVYNVADGCDYKYDNGWVLKQEDELSLYVKVKDFTFSTGYTITDQRQCLLNLADNKYYQWFGALPKVVPAGSTPATAGGVGVGVWSDKTDLMLRSELSLSSGSGLSGFSQTEIYPSGTVGEKLKQIVSVTDAPFNAISGVDSTAAIDAAAASAQYVFVPEGQFISTNASLAYWKFFGFGSLRVGNLTYDLSPYPQNGNTLKSYKTQTFGNYENAAAASITANVGFGQTKENTQLTGTTTAYLASNYRSFDHAAQYVAASSFPAVTTTAASTTFTTNTITAPEINNTNTKVGMYIWVPGATGYIGKVLSVSGTTATVDGWYIWGIGSTGTPPSPSTVAARINPNTKIWVHNSNLFLPATGDATNGVGFELGLVVNKSGAGANTWGYDCVTLGSETPYAHFISRNAKTHGFLALTGGAFGFASAANTVGIEVRDSTSYNYTTTVSGNRKWSIDAAGAVCRDYRKLTVYTTASWTASHDDSVILSTAVSALGQIPQGGANRVFTIKALNSCTISLAGGLIDGAATLAIPANTTATIISDGTNGYNIK